MEKVHHVNTNKKKATLTLNKGEFRTKITAWDEECHFIMTKESIHQEDITTINVYVSGNRASQYRKQILVYLQEERASPQKYLPIFIFLSL